jgi:hypothetical protein
LAIGERTRQTPRGTKREKEGQRRSLQDEKGTPHFWKTQKRAGKLPEKIKRRKPLFCVAPSKKIADFPKSAGIYRPFAV